MTDKIYYGNQPILKLYQGENLVKNFSVGKINPNEVPYISTYYIKPIVDINEEVIINYYVTDYFQKEYKEDDTLERFKVEYWIDNIKQKITNVVPGDNGINIGKLSVGDKLLALQATDSVGRKSHRLFQEIRVIDKGEQEKLYNTYYVSDEDLSTYNIFKDNTMSIETTMGINELIKWAVQKQYNKVVLPSGKYKISETSGIQLVGIKNFTLDLNGSTFKLNPNALAKCMMVTIQDCIDCHVINGVIEGDINEHDYANAPNNSEWVNGVTINGGKYNSFENLTIKDIAGYGTNTMFGSNPIAGETGGFNFALGDIIEGKWVASSERYSSQNFVPLSDYRMDLKPPKEKYDYTRTGFFQLGAYLGYQGNVTDNWVYKVTFYNENKEYLESIEGYAYRRLYVPQNAKFVRITLFSSTIPSQNMGLFSIDTPLNCAFKNIYHQNNRAVGMALTSFVNLLVEGCTFDKCGYTLAKCAFDAEDGWDMMQDLTFRNNTFINNPYNNFLTCAGHNFIIEDNQQIGLYLWERTRNYVVRNNVINQGGQYRYESFKKTGYVRIQCNTNLVGLGIKLINAEEIFVIRNERYMHCSPDISNYVSTSNKGGVKVIQSSFEYDPTKGINGCPRYAEFIKCNFNNYKAYLSDNSIFNQCTFSNSMDLRLHGSTKKQFIECKFNNCWMKAQGTMDAVFDRCKFYDMTLYLDGYDNKANKIDLKSCIVEVNTKEFINLRTSTPVIVSNTNIINHNPGKYYVINCSKNGLASGELTLESNVITQERGSVITGTSISSGTYLFVLEENTIIGEATLIDDKYKGSNNIVLVN